jgi:hypothetical protein
VRRAALATAASALVVVAGCGGGGGKSTGGTSESGRSSTTAPTPALTRAEFLARGDRLCQSYRAQVRAIPAPSASATPAETVAYLRALATVATRLLTQFSALTPPPGDAAAVNQYLSSMKTQIQLTNQVADELSGGNAAAAKAHLQSLQRAAPQVRALAHGYGFKVCGSPQS